MEKETTLQLSDEQIEFQIEGLDREIRELQVVHGRLKELGDQRNRLAQQLENSKRKREQQLKAQITIKRMGDETERLQQSPQGSIAKELAGVITTILAHPELAQLLGEVSIKNLEYLFSRHGMKSIEVVIDRRKSCNLVIAEDGSYTIIYHSTDDAEKSILKEVYKSAPDEDPRRYYLDQRFLALRIDTQAEQPMAIPVTIFTDTAQPTTGGKIMWKTFNPPFESIYPLIEQIRDILVQGDIVIGNQKISRKPKQPIQGY